MEAKRRRWWTRGIVWLLLLASSGLVLSGLFQLAVLLAPGYRQDLEREASAALGQPVEVDALALRWQWFKPLLELRGVRLPGAAPATPALDIERLRLGFALGALLHGEWLPTEVQVDGLALAVEIDAEGRWRLRGRDPQGEAPSFAEIARTLKRFSRLRAEQVRLQVVDRRDAAAGVSVLLQRADLRLEGEGFELRAEAQAPELIAARLRLRAGMAGDLEKPGEWRGRWTLDASGVAAGPPLARRLPMLARLHGRDVVVTASGDWQQGAPAASQLALRAQSLALQGDPASVLRDVDLGLHYRPAGESRDLVVAEGGLLASLAARGGTLDFVPLRLAGQRGLWPVTTARLDWRPVTTDESQAATHQWRFNSEFLRLDDLAPWMAALAANRPAADIATLKSLRGDVGALEGRWQSAGASSPARYGLHARLSGFAARLQRAEPNHGGSVQGVDGGFTLDDSGGRATLTSKGLSFEVPALFATAQRATRFEAEAQWRRDGEAWNLKLPRFEWALLGSSGRGSAEARLPPQGRPDLKLKIGFDVEDVAALKPLIPVHWGESLKDWLDRAIVRGRVANAELTIDGPMVDFPFHQRPTGRWQLLLPISGTRLEYHRDWPGVDQLNALLKFSGNGMSFESQRGLISGVAVTDAKGGIADFKSSPLIVDGRTAGESPNYYAFLRASPLATRLQSLLTRSQPAGPAETSVHLEIPLHRPLEGEPAPQTVARGTVRLLGIQLSHTALDRPVDGITGTLRFGEGAGVTADDLAGRFHDTPLRAAIAAGAEGGDVLTAHLDIDLGSAEVPVQGIAARYLPGWLLPQLSGKSEWRARIPLSGASSGHVQLDSTLVGTRIALPPPLAKAAADAAPIALELAGNETQPLTVSAELPGRFGLGLRFDHGGPRGALERRGVMLRLGAGPTPAIPTADGWRLSGRLPLFEPTQWSAVVSALRATPAGEVSAPGTDDSLPFLGATLDVEALRLSGYELPAVRLEAQREYGGVAVRLDGAGTRGTLKLPADGKSLSGQFAALHLRPAPKQPGVAASGETEPLDPRKAPTLDLAVEALRIGDQNFGRLSLASERTANGQRLRRLAIEGGVATLDADGEWRRAKGLTEAESRFTVTSNDLAGTLEALGFARTVSGRNARIEGSLSWPAAAGGFDWALARGTVTMAVEDGALRTVEPGSTSRVLGLFNFYALPRRLSLDFGDVVSKGLGFDRIDGTFQLADGVAHTDDLTVKGPSVHVAVQGNVGLKAQTYDQVITVTPNTKGITLGALLLGGATALAAPVLPLIAIIANQVIDKPLGQITQLGYRLTGSWENPEIRKLDGTMEAPPAATVEGPIIPPAKEPKP